MCGCLQGLQLGELDGHNAKAFHEVCPLEEHSLCADTLKEQFAIWSINAALIFFSEGIVIPRVAHGYAVTICGQ